MTRILLLIGTGSFIGGVSRFLLSRFVQNSVLTAFPLGTFIVNIAGCFLIGLIFGLSERGNIADTGLRMFLTVGFCGGFTTFSTFANENLSLLRDGNIFQFAIYSALSVFLGILATYLGNLIIKII